MTAFHHPAYLIAQLVFLESTALLHVTLSTPEIHDMHQFGIAINDDVRIVGDDDELATQLVYWSRNFSASSAAMQPKPADVIAWR